MCSNRIDESIDGSSPDVITLEKLLQKKVYFIHEEYTLNLRIDQGFLDDEIRVSKILDVNETKPSLMVTDDAGVWDDSGNADAQSYTINENGDFAIYIENDEYISFIPIGIYTNSYYTVSEKPFIDSSMRYKGGFVARVRYAPNQFETFRINMRCDGMIERFKLEKAIDEITLEPTDMSDLFDLPKIKSIIFNNSEMYDRVILRKKIKTIDLDFGISPMNTKFIHLHSIKTRDFKIPKTKKDKTYDVFIIEYLGERYIGFQLNQISTKPTLSNFDVMINGEELFNIAKAPGEFGLNSLMNIMALVDYNIEPGDYIKINSDKYTLNNIYMLSDVINDGFQGIRIIK